MTALGWEADVPSPHYEALGPMVFIDFIFIN